MKRENVLTVNQGTYFKIPIVVLGSMLIFGALAVLLTWIWHAVTFDAPFKDWSTMLIDFSLFELPIMLLLVAAGSFLIWAVGFYEFDPDTKEMRRGGRFWHWEWGKWQPLVLTGSRIAFQRYEQTSNYSYGGLLSKNVQEYVYELRLVKSDDTFEPILSGSDFRTVAQIIILGKKLGEVYELPFYDYVKEIVKKQMR